MPTSFLSFPCSEDSMVSFDFRGLSQEAPNRRISKESPESLYCTNIIYETTYLTPEKVEESWAVMTTTGRHLWITHLY